MTATKVNDTVPHPTAYCCLFPSILFRDLVSPLFAKSNHQPGISYIPSIVGLRNICVLFFISQWPCLNFGASIAQHRWDFKISVLTNHTLSWLLLDFGASNSQHQWNFEISVLTNHTLSWLLLDSGASIRAIFNVILSISGFGYHWYDLLLGENLPQDKKRGAYFGF